MLDPTYQHLSQLAAPMRVRMVLMLNVIRSAGVPLIITSSRRSMEEQARLVRAGLSKTMNSPHLRGMAADVDVMGYKRDDVPVWFWELLGPWAESNLGLTWGGRWSGLRDYGHFELSSPRSPV